MRRRRKQGELWAALPHLDISPKRVGGQGRLRRLVLGTALSHTRACYKTAGYRRKRAAAMADAGHPQAGESDAELECPHCEAGEHGNDEHMHLRCTNPYLECTGNTGAVVVAGAATRQGAARQ